MEKFRIYASGNETIKGDFSVSYYILEKSPKFLNWLSRLVSLLDIKDDNVKIVRKSKEDKDGNFIGEEIYIKEIDKMIDVHEHYENTSDRIDLFYGKDRIYLTLRKSKESREKIGDFLVKTAEWIKIEEIEREKIKPYFRKAKDE